jgi:hypothetical protein
MRTLTFPNALLVLGLLAVSACAPTTGEVTRLSTRDQPPCAFGPGSCVALHRLRPPVW